MPAAICSNRLMDNGWMNNKFYLNKADDVWMQALIQDSGSCLDFMENMYFFLLLLFFLHEIYS